VADPGCIASLALPHDRPMSAQAKTAQKSTPKNQPVRYVVILLFVLHVVTRLMWLQPVELFLKIELI
jgi:hypothetical protein